MKKSVFLLSLLVFYAASNAQNVTVGPYLQSPTDNSIKILWRTDSASTSKIMYGTSLGNLTLMVEDTTPVTRHAVKVTGLSPYTKYYYAVYNNGVMSEGDDNDHWFRTFPTAGTIQPIRVWAIGDFGKGNSHQQMVRDAYLNYDNKETDLWLWLGDNVYNDGTEAEYLAKVFDSVNGYQKNMKYMPFEPCPGNHDYNSVSPVTSPQPPLQHSGPYYDFVDVYKNGEAGGVATGHELFYSYDYGNVHFVSLNSELGSIFSQNDDWVGANPFFNFTSSPMSQWLHQDLQANTQPWVVVYFHQPPYTDGSHDASQFWEVFMKAMRENYAKIWEQYGVDLVVCGHSHVYERSYLVKGAYGDPADITTFNFVQSTSGIDSLGEAYIKYTQGANPNQGTVYVVNGNSGSNDSSPSFQHPYMYSEYGCDTCCGSLILDINGDRLDGRHLDEDGVIRDHFTMKKMAAPNALDDIEATGAISKLSVSPNPFSNSTNVSFMLNKTCNLRISLTDATGRLIEVQKGEFSKGANSVTIESDKYRLAKGTYTLRVTGSEGQAVKTIVVQ